MAPSSFYQVYTLHGYVHGEAMALAWAFLPNKSQASYAELFGVLRDTFIRMFGDAGQYTFFTDFELAAINAIKSTFPASVVKGFTFHFRQAVTRKVCKFSSRISLSNCYIVLIGLIR